jgi:hypothetical protein
VVGLAVGDDFFVGGDAQLFEDLRHVLADAQAARRVHAGGPFEIDRAGNVSAPGGDDLLAGIFQRATGVPDRQVAGAETALQVFASGGGFFVQHQADWAYAWCRNVNRHRQALVQPGQQASVEVVIIRMPDHIEQPDKASGPAAALVVIHHVDCARVMPEFAEQRFQVGFCRQQARRRGLAQLRAFRIDEARARNVPGAVACSAGQVHQNQIGSIEARQELARLDYQRQAREVRHVRSPGGAKGKDCSKFSGRGW